MLSGRDPSQTPGAVKDERAGGFLQNCLEMSDIWSLKFVLDGSVPFVYQLGFTLSEFSTDRKRMEKDGKGRVSFIVHLTSIPDTTKH